MQQEKQLHRYKKGRSKIIFLRLYDHMGRKSKGIPQNVPELRNEFIKFTGSKIKKKKIQAVFLGISCEQLECAV